LTEDEVKQIAKLYLKATQKRMEQQGKKIVVSEAALDWVVEKGFSPAYGARFLKRTIDEQIKLPITNLWKAFNSFKVDLVDGQLDIRGE
jgi:ATP-dependent Clp protease ATP-binding subunit ClpC